MNKKGPVIGAIEKKLWDILINSGKLGFFKYSPYTQQFKRKCIYCPTFCKDFFFVTIS